MLQTFKKISWILLLAFGLQTSWAFSLLGPLPGYPGLPANFGDSWQVTAIGYGPTFAADIGGPKNIGEGYRRNAQTYYWACDANFLNFFGSDGEVAITNAFYILNNSLTNVDGYSTALTEFPLNSQAINFEASALGLLDLKSETLGAMVEQMGLANAVRFSWTLHDRFLPNGAMCPAYEYLVVQRNFDITASPLDQLQYSPYVNGTLYSYLIEDVCPASVPDPQAVAVPLQVDPSQNSFAPVSGMDASDVLLGGNTINAGLQTGGFYTGLTRDDVAGLRYLYSTNYLAFESPTTGSLLVNSSGPGGTNYGAPFVLYTSNYTAFALSALTNDPVTLSNLFPGLIITSSSANFFIQYTTNFTAYFTNLIGAPAGSQKLVVVGVGVPAVATNYTYTFANVVIPPGSSTNKNTKGLLLTVNIAPKNGAPAGSPLFTNITSKSITLTNVPSGDYYINTNPCGPNLILSTLFTNVVATTNLIVSASNAAGLFFSQSLVTFSTNHWYVAEPIVCGAVAGGTTTNTPGLFEGVGSVQFVQTFYDSLVGQFYQPITNTYSQVVIVNGKRIKQTFQRVVTTPDVLFSASDLAGSLGGSYNPTVPTFARNINFNVSNIPVPLGGSASLAGPGTIDPFTVVTFDKIGTVYENGGPANNQADGGTVLNWGSFDGSTNDPIVYPNGTSIANLNNQILVQITPATLPDGTNDVAYPIQSFTITGGTFSPPFTWSLAPGSGALPAGLMLNPDGTISSDTNSVLPGIPTQSGIFDFNVELTDSLSRTVTWSYALNIQPSPSVNPLSP